MEAFTLKSFPFESRS